MGKLTFVAREELSDYEWDNQRKDWVRPHIQGETLKRLAERSTLNGLLRVGFFVALLAVSAVATVLVARVSLWLALPVLFVYYFFYGFWVAIAHELQHQTVFAKSANWLSEILFFFVQTLIWNSPRYSRISHKLHHRFTMVRGLDPETDWPEVITVKWMRSFLLNHILRILVVGADQLSYRAHLAQHKACRTSLQRKGPSAEYQISQGKPIYQTDLLGTRRSRRPSSLSHSSFPQPAGAAQSAER